LPWWRWFWYGPRPECRGGALGMSDREPQGGPLVGAVLEGAYRLTRLIGEGGMGAVYEARHLRLGQRVAVKVMARDLATNQEALMRFRREAEVTSQLGHPHIVQVFDFGTAPTGEPYLVMEFLEGEDLEARLRRVGHLPLATVVGIIKQLASALEAAHARGVVHRDLKPANIFLVAAAGMRDFVKIVDFGISKARAGSKRLTRGSVVMGTPGYMSPEQARGRSHEIDHRSDQWAGAAIAWEALAGRPPFNGDDIPSLLYQIVHEDPPPLVSDVPGLVAEVESILRRALSKRRSERFPSIAAFADALERTISTVSIGLDVDSPTRVSTSAPGTLLYKGVLEAQDELTQVAPPPKPTTLSRSAGELHGPIGRFRDQLKARWILATVSGAILLVGGSLLVRTLSHAANPSPGASTAPTFPAGSATSAVRPTVVPLPLPASPAMPSIDHGTTQSSRSDVTASLPSFPNRPDREPSADRATVVPRAASERQTPTPAKTREPIRVEVVDPFLVAVPPQKVDSTDPWVPKETETRATSSAGAGLTPPAPDRRAPSAGPRRTSHPPPDSPASTPPMPAPAAKPKRQVIREL
jgi:serine/threonine protein kinase